jgi:hypothetical protein
VDTATEKDRETNMPRWIIGATAALVMSTTVTLAQSRPPGQMPIENRRAAMLTEATIADADGKVVGRLARPLAAGKKSAIRLQQARGCDFTVQAKFDDEGEIDETVNLCREKVLRFVE